MTPEAYINCLARLIEAGRDEEALEFAARHDQQMRPHLTIEQVELKCAWLEGAALVASMAEADARLEARAAASSPISADRL